jgi:hypothetical protein
VLKVTAITMRQNPICNRAHRNARDRESHADRIRQRRGGVSK